jgi:hypothetical protein
MAAELTLSGTATAALAGNWELRAGSHDTAGWLDGQATTGYPGSLDGFKPQNVADGGSESNNQGYASAPKMALINVTNGADGETIILGGGASAILSVMATPAEGTPVLTGATFSGLEVTMQYASGSTNVTTVMVLYN